MDLLKTNGNEVFIFAFSNKKKVKDSSRLIIHDCFYEKNQNPVIFLFRYLLRFYIDPRIIVKLRHFIRNTRPDIIHIHANDKYGISVLMGLLDCGIPVIQSVHAYTIVCMSKTSKKPSGGLCRYSYGFGCFTYKCLPVWKFFTIVPPYALKWSITKRVVDEFIAPNIQIKNRLISCGALNVSVIEHFVYTTRKRPDKEFVERGNILCVGRISEEKGFQFIIKAMMQIRQNFETAKLHICGDGPYLDNLKHLTKDLGLEDSVIFHGYINHSDLEIFYEKANVVVFPSMCLEICGLVNLEALAHARPVIISNQCGINELFNDKKIGFLTDPSNVKAISENILTILKDWILFQEMSQNAYQLYLSRFSPEIHYDKIIAEYSTLIQRKKNSNKVH